MFNIRDNFIRMKYKENFCRYDVFKFIYYFVLEDMFRDKLILKKYKEL